MSFKDRLGRLTGEEKKPVREDSRQERLGELRRRIEEVMNRRDRIVPAPEPRPKAPAVPLERVVTGEEAITEHGRFFFSRSTYAPDDPHGSVRVRDFAGPSMQAASILAGTSALAGMSIEDGLFLDTETTGLAGGTGTFPFLIGLGWFEAGSFTTCQLFARDFSEERAMLVFLRQIANSRKFLVTFNGRAYDLGLLSARYILNRTEDVLTAMPHIDLLHPSRRMLGHRLENARLVTIEACVLGVRRVDDVPGYEIPQRYFEWLRRRDGALMEDVFRHNRLDIVSMASLLKHLTDLLEGGGTMAAVHHGDLLCAARLHHDRGDLDTACRMLEPLAGSDHAGVSRDARKTLSLIRKKSGAWNEAVALWEEMLAADPHDVFAAEELAKFHEHHAREFALAAGLVRRVLETAQGLGGDERRAWEHRMERLLRKASR